MKLLLISHLNTNRWPLQKRDKILFLIRFHGGFLACQVLEHRFPVSPMNAN
jgi:hypothetical protein